MNLAAVAIFIAGLAFVIGVFIASDRSVGPLEIVIVAIAAVAWLGWSAIRRSGGIQPSRCPSCDGLVSIGDAVCKHCGSAIAPRQDAR